MRVWSLAAVLILPLVSAAHAVVIFDNFGPGYEFNGGQGNPVIGSATNDGYDRSDMAFGFTATATHDLDSIALAMAVGNQSVPVNQLALSLCSDATGQPGGVLESWIIRVPIEYGFGFDNPPLLASSVLKPTLTAGTRYWLLGEAGTNASIFRWSLNNTGDVGPLSFRTNGGPWVTFDETHAAFQLNGADAIPEPATLALFGLGVVAIVLRRRRPAAR